MKTRKTSRLLRITKNTPRPRKIRCHKVAAAREEFMKHFGDYYPEMKRLDRLVDAANNDDSLFEKASAKVRKLKSMDVHKSAVLLQREMQRGSTIERINKYYWIEKNLEKSSDICSPDLDKISSSWVYPGMLVTLKGNCFGSRRGKVYFKISPSLLFDSTILEWSSIEILVHYYGSSSVSSRPFDGSVWVVSEDGKTSNELPVRTIPTYTMRNHCLVKHACGGLWGKKVDKTHLNGEKLNDPDFTVPITHSHYGDGWSKLRNPMGGGQQLAQGYHIGVDAFDSAWMYLDYYLYGPEGIASPSIPGVSWPERPGSSISLEEFRSLGLV
jgi:hypothetical protein